MKKILIGFAGLALILFVLPMVVMSERLDDPRENRDCYKGNLPFYVCVITGTNIMESSFLTYQPMHEYYTPQLKEIDWSIGNQAVIGKKAVNLKIGAYTVGNMNDLEYSYVKHT